jgi:hypothetical protein
MQLEEEADAQKEYITGLHKDIGREDDQGMCGMEERYNPWVAEVGNQRMYKSDKWRLGTARGGKLYKFDRQVYATCHKRCKVKFTV